MLKNRFAFFEAAEMREILKHVFGASEKDLLELEDVCDNMNQDPHLPFRKSSMYRLGLDLKLGTGNLLDF